MRSPMKTITLYVAEQTILDQPVDVRRLLVRLHLLVCFAPFAQIRVAILQVFLVRHGDQELTAQRR